MNDASMFCVTYPTCGMHQSIYATGSRGDMTQKVNTGFCDFARPRKPLPSLR